MGVTSYLGGILKYLLSAIISIAIIVYIFYHLTGGFSPDVETFTAALTTAEETITSNAIVMRNEDIVYSTVTGTTSYLVNDGEKVKNGGTVAEIYPTSDNEETYQDIFALNKRIALLEASNMTENERRSDTESTDKLIWSNIYSYLEYCRKGNMTSADTSKDNLLINLNKRRIITKSISGYGSLIAELKEERDELAATVSNTPTTVKSNSAGYFYSFVDGYEEIFSSSNISLLTFESFQKKKNEESTDFSGSGFGYPIGKTVTDYVWYVACEVEYSELHYFERGKTYSVRFPQNNDTTVSMYLYRILYSVDSDTAILILRASVLPDNFSYTRNQTVQIVRKSYTGYRIPTSSVHMLEGYQIVYTLKGSKVIMKRVEPLYEYDGYFIVKEYSYSADDPIIRLNKNDLVITEGKNLYDGKIIG